MASSVAVKATSSSSSRSKSNNNASAMNNAAIGRGAGAASGGGSSEDPLSTAASVLTSISNSMPVAYTPTTHRVSKAKKGKKVHVCEFGCGKVFSRAEHRRRHEANHRAEPLYRCTEPGCEKTFQRPDLLNRHLERQHNYRTTNATTAQQGLNPHADNNGAGNLSTDGSRFPQSPGSPTMNDFDAYGDEIRELYLRQNRPLREIKAYMEGKHQFPPLDDHVYEQAFNRLCLNKTNSPVATAQMALSPGAAAQWDLHRAQIGEAPHIQALNGDSSMQDLHHLLTSAVDSDLGHDIGGYDPVQQLRHATQGYAGSDEPKDDGLSGISNRIPLDPLLRGPQPQAQIDCPAPECDRRGNEGFVNQTQLWEHLVTKHGISQPGR